MSSLGKWASRIEQAMRYSFKQGISLVARLKPHPYFFCLSVLIGYSLTASSVLKAQPAHTEQLPANAPACSAGVALPRFDQTKDWRLKGDSISSQHEETMRRVLLEAFGLEYSRGRYAMVLLRSHTDKAWRLLIIDNKSEPSNRLVAEGQLIEWARFNFAPHEELSEHARLEMEQVGLRRYDVFYMVGELIGATGYRRIVVADLSEYEFDQRHDLPAIAQTVRTFAPYRDDLSLNKALRAARLLAQPQGLGKPGPNFNGHHPLCLDGGGIDPELLNRCCAELGGCITEARQEYADHLAQIIGLQVSGVAVAILLGTACAPIGEMAVLFCLGGTIEAAILVPPELRVLATLRFQSKLLDCEIAFQRCLRE